MQRGGVHTAMRSMQLAYAFAAILMTACTDVPQNLEKLRTAQAQLEKNPRDREALDFILGKLHDSRKITRNNAAAFLRLLASKPEVRAAIAPRAVPALIEAAQHRDDNEAEAITALGEFRELGAPAIPTLISRVQESSDRSGDAAEALGKIGPAAKPALPSLRALLHRGLHRDVVAKDAIAIRTLAPDDRESIEALIGLVRSNDRDDRVTGIYSLSVLSGLALPAVPSLESYETDDLRSWAHDTAAQIK